MAQAEVPLVLQGHTSAEVVTHGAVGYFARLDVRQLKAFVIHLHTLCLSNIPSNFRLASD